jgi:ribosomal protein L11 methyltransferase
VDNDPQALTATRDNAARNGVESVIECFTPEAFTPTSADVMLANILAGPLVELAQRLSGSLKPGGKLVLSGILEQQADEVKNAYLAEFPDIRVKHLDGWVLLTGGKQG